jgi:hypothetical protein
MKPRFVDAPASATNPNQHRSKCFTRSVVKAALLVGALFVGGLIQSADANLLITTTGTIMSGSETGGLFGLPTTTTSLAGSSYTLVVNYNRLGPNYFTTGDGTFAQDNETPGTTGYVTAIINGHSLTTTLTSSLGSSLIADLFDFVASNQGYNGTATTGAFVNVLQELSCANACVPYANLMTNFHYTLGPDDFGTDLYTYQGAGFPAAGTPTATFIGMQTTFAAAPEPASWVLLVTGLFALGMVVRRGRV